MLKCNLQFFAHKKGVGSTRNGTSRIFPAASPGKAATKRLPLSAVREK